MGCPNSKNSFSKKTKQNVSPDKTKSNTFLAAKSPKIQQIYQEKSDENFEQSKISVIVGTMKNHSIIEKSRTVHLPHNKSSVNNDCYQFVKDMKVDNLEHPKLFSKQSNQPLKEKITFPNSVQKSCQKSVDLAEHRYGSSSDSVSTNTIFTTSMKNGKSYFYKERQVSKKLRHSNKDKAALIWHMINTAGTHIKFTSKSTNKKSDKAIFKNVNIFSEQEENKERNEHGNSEILQEHGEKNSITTNTDEKSHSLNSATSHVKKLASFWEDKLNFSTHMKDVKELQEINISRANIENHENNKEETIKNRQNCQFQEIIFTLNKLQQILGNLPKECPFKESDVNSSYCQENVNKTSADFKNDSKSLSSSILYNHIPNSLKLLTDHLLNRLTQNLITSSVETHTDSDHIKRGITNSKTIILPDISLLQNAKDVKEMSKSLATLIVCSSVTKNVDKFHLFNEILGQINIIEKKNQNVTSLFKKSNDLQYNSVINIEHFSTKKKIYNYIKHICEIIIMVLIAFVYYILSHWVILW